MVSVTLPRQGRRIGYQLMLALVEGLDKGTVLLHASADGRGLYKRLSFALTGGL